MIVIGIDPGWSGGIATVGAITNATGFSNMTELDILNTIKAYRSYTDTCYMERVHSMPKQGVSSSFKFGHNYGFVRACVLSLGMVMIDVTPQKWQGALGCLTKGDKNITKSRAQQWFPGIKVTHAVADALLIAEYGRRMETKEERIEFI